MNGDNELLPKNHNWENPAVYLAESQWDKT